MLHIAGISFLYAVSLTAEIIA